MANCDAMRAGKGHRVGEKQSGLRDKAGTASPKQPHSDHPSKGRKEREERGERQSGDRDQA